MADELSTSLEVSYSKNGVTEEISETDLITVTGSELVKYIQSVGTSEEALELGQDIGTPGYVYLKNLDDTNFVSIRRASGEGNMIKLLPGEWAWFRMAATAPYAIADTAACRLKVVVFET